MKGILHIRGEFTETIINLENVTVIQDSTRRSFPEVAFYSTDGNDVKFWEKDAKKLSSVIEHLINVQFPDVLTYIDLTMEVK